MTNMTPGKRFFHSIGFKILSAYILLSLISLSFIVSIIFENQTDLISRNTRLESEKQLAELIDSMKKFSLETKKGSLFTQGKNSDALKQTLDLLNIQSRNYFVFSEKGEILLKSAEGINPPETYLSDGLRSLTAMTFSGREYYLRIDDQKQIMYCYIPLSGFQLGSTILLLEKQLNGMSESLTYLYHQALYVIFIVLFFHTIFAFLLFRYIIKPVNILISGAESIAEGKLNTRIHLPGREDEFASLAHTFNRMAESLHSNVESLSGEITAARETIERSEKLSTRDELTGLYNRQYFIERLDEENKKNSSGNPSTGLMLIEPDSFGEITSIYGHQTENIIISEIAKKIMRTLNNGETAARLSREMFAVLFTGTDVQVIKETAGRIKRNIDESPVITADGEFRITVSIFIACSSKGAGLDLEKLEEKAAHALQNNGQSRVEIIP